MPKAGVILSRSTCTSFAQPQYATGGGDQDRNLTKSGPLSAVTNVASRGSLEDKEKQNTRAEGMRLEQYDHPSDRNQNRQSEQTEFPLKPPSTHKRWTCPSPCHKSLIKKKDQVEPHSHPIRGKKIPHLSHRWRIRQAGLNRIGA